jgi:hypothetical protein
MLIPTASDHPLGASLSAAASFAAASATVFHSLGILQNSIAIPSSLYRSTSPNSASQRSLFWTPFPARVTQPFSIHLLAQLVEPSTTYSESVATTRVWNPSPGQYRKRRAAMTARSSARLLVWRLSSPKGPFFSKRPEATSRLPEGPKPCQKAQPAFGFCWPLSRHAPSQRIRAVRASFGSVYLRDHYRFS